MSFFKNIGLYVGKGLKEVVEAPIDLTKGILEGAELIKNEPKKENKEKKDGNKEN